MQYVAVTLPMVPFAVNPDCFDHDALYADSSCPVVPLNESDANATLVIRQIKIVDIKLRVVHSPVVVEHIAHPVCVVPYLIDLSG